VPQGEKFHNATAKGINARRQALKQLYNLYKKLELEMPIKKEKK